MNHTPRVKHYFMIDILMISRHFIKRIMGTTRHPLIQYLIVRALTEISNTKHGSVDGSKIVGMIREIVADRRNLEISFQDHAVIPMIIDKHENHSVLIA